MAKGKRHRCKDCGRTDDVTHISRNGLCQDCAVERMQRNADLARAVRYAADGNERALAWMMGGGHKGRPSTPYQTDTK